MTIGKYSKSRAIIATQEFISFRTCNAMLHFEDAFFVPNLIGIQGRASLSSQ